VLTLHDIGLLAAFCVNILSLWGSKWTVRYCSQTDTEKVSCRPMDFTRGSDWPSHYNLYSTNQFNFYHPLSKLMHEWNFFLRNFGTRAPFHKLPSHTATNNNILLVT